MTVSPFSALVLFLCRLSLCSAFGALTSPALKASAAEPQAQSERTTAHCTTTNASQPWALRTEAIDGCGSNKPLHRVFRSRHDFSAEWRLGGYGTGYHLGVGRMLLKVAERNAYPQPIDIQLICHKGMEESSDVQPPLGLPKRPERFEKICKRLNDSERMASACPAIPGILLRSRQNPCHTPFRMLDGAHRLCSYKNTLLDSGGAIIEREWEGGWRRRWRRS